MVLILMFSLVPRPSVTEGLGTRLPHVMQLLQPFHASAHWYSPFTQLYHSPKENKTLNSTLQACGECLWPTFSATQHLFLSSYNMLFQCLFSHTSQKAQLRAPLSPLQTAWTGFDSYLYSGGSSSAGPALVEIATAKSFILNRGIVTDTMSATPLEPGW